MDASMVSSQRGDASHLHRMGQRITARHGVNREVSAHLCAQRCKGWLAPDVGHIGKHLNSGM